jgi:pSer/pThr/pTyr-binding forkhead associated (FHA) protein
LELVDNDSQNGTRVNGRPSPPHQPVVVSPGDVLNFGTVTCKLVDAGGLHDLLR